jgi:hypothetical protein
MERFLNNKKLPRFRVIIERRLTYQNLRGIDDEKLRAVRTVAKHAPAGRRFHARNQRQRGEGGIRTLGGLLGYGALAKRCFQPLSHLSRSPPRLESLAANNLLSQRSRSAFVKGVRAEN